VDRTVIMTPMSPPSKWPAPDSAPSVTSPPSFPPPDGSIAVGSASSADPGDSSSKSPRSRWVLAVCAIGVVALVASTAGVFLGNHITDWMNEPPSRSSDEAINVAAPRDAIERRIDIGAVVDHVAPTIVTISADMDGGQSLGTGVIITTDGEILTNAHVVNGASSIRVRVAGETEPREVNLLAMDVGNDLALLRMEGDGFEAATFADPDSVRLGDEVIAIGFALGLDGDPSVTLGIVSALDRTIGTDGAFLDGLIQTDAAISSGNSGGALVNAAGEVVGINTAVARGSSTTAATNVGFAISVREALPVIDALRAQANGTERAEAYLGVGLADRTDGGQGAIVTSVDEGTPAADAGVQIDDLVVAVDGATIDGSTGLIAAIRDLEPGTSIELTIVRDGEEQNFDITLTVRPSDIPD
jgi:S1-C subfamily serine protease